MRRRTRPALSEIARQTRDLDQGIGEVGFDELMIVNPGTPGDVRAVSFRRARLESVEPAHAPRTRASRFLMGADGALYEVIE